MHATAPSAPQLLRLRVAVLVGLLLVGGLPCGAVPANAPPGAFVAVDSNAAESSATSATHGGGGGKSTNSSGTPLECLLLAADALEGDASSNVTYMGCVPPSLMTVLFRPPSPFANTSSFSSSFTSRLSFAASQEQRQRRHAGAAALGIPTLNHTFACGEACLLWASRNGTTSTPSSSSSSSSSGSGSGGYTTTFAVSEESWCRCVQLADGWNASFATVPGNGGGWRNWSNLCTATGPAVPLKVFKLSLPCPVNVSQCGEAAAASSGCSLVGSCCVQDGSSSSDGRYLPSAYLRSMVQWVSIIIITLAVIEGVVYGCVRSRRAASERTAVERSTADVRELTTRLLADITDNNSDVDPPVADDCTICLDPLTTRPVKVLPCGHRLHRHCLEQYISHEIQDADSVSCPMCRAALVVRSRSANGDGGLQVAVHVNAVL